MAKKESWSTFFFRKVMNIWPCFRGTGAKLLYISADWKSVEVKLPLNWRTRNYVNTIFGGSIYAAVDPFYMLMLIKILGPEYIVWDTEAEVDFIRPGKSTLYARFEIRGEEIETIKRLLETERSIVRVYTVDLVDKENIPHARVIKHEYIRKKDSSSIRENTI
jgi:acyl-coenzyme A thioesterase PaaI-like protein